jgi:hypothetical protein
LSEENHAFDAWFQKAFNYTQKRLLLCYNSAGLPTTQESKGGIQEWTMRVQHTRNRTANIHSQQKGVEIIEAETCAVAVV